MADGRADMVAIEPRFLPLRQGDFDQFRAAATGALAEALRPVASLKLTDESDAWAYWRGGVIRGLGAFSRITPHRWVIWSFPGDLSMADWKRVMRFVSYRIATKMADPACWRIEATARADNPGALALLVRLGFREEALMKGYGAKGEAHRLFAIVREGI